MKAEAENAPTEEISWVAMNSGSTAIGAGAGRVGAMTTAGSGVWAVQQFVWAVLSGADARAQQLCADLWVLSRQVPSGASIVPINRMATVARKKKPSCMRAVYHLAHLMERYASLDIDRSRNAPVAGRLFPCSNLLRSPANRKREFPYCTFIVPLCHLPKHPISPSECMAGTTGLEPATSAVTGQRSNQLSYVPEYNLDISILSPAKAIPSNLRKPGRFSWLAARSRVRTRVG